MNVTNNLKSEVDDHMTSGSQVISVNQSSGVEEEVEVPEPDEAEVSVFADILSNQFGPRSGLTLLKYRWKDVQCRPVHYSILEKI